MVLKKEYTDNVNYQEISQRANFTITIKTRLLNLSLVEAIDDEGMSGVDRVGPLLERIVLANSRRSESICERRRRKRKRRESSYAVASKVTSCCT